MWFFNPYFYFWKFIFFKFRNLLAQMYLQCCQWVLNICLQPQTPTLVTTSNTFFTFETIPQGVSISSFQKPVLEMCILIFLFNKFLVFVIPSFSLKTIDIFLRLVFKSRIFPLNHF